MEEPINSSSEQVSPEQPVAVAPQAEVEQVIGQIQDETIVETSDPTENQNQIVADVDAEERDAEVESGIEAAIEAQIEADIEAEAEVEAVRETLQESAQELSDAQKYPRIMPRGQFQF